MKTSAIIRPRFATRRLFVLISAGCMLTSLLIFRSTTKFIRESASTTGHISNYVMGRSRGNETYTPQIRFQSPSGEIIVFTANFYSRLPLGSGVRVLYDPRNPHHAKLDDFMELWLWCILLFFIGLVILASMANDRKQRSWADVPPSMPPPSKPSDNDLPNIIR
jgi:hypothetical protein